MNKEDLPDDGGGFTTEPAPCAGEARARKGPTERSDPMIPLFDETRRPAGAAARSRPRNGAPPADAEVGRATIGGERQLADAPSSDGLLSRICAVLANTPDHALALQTALELSLPWLGDWAILDLLSESGDVTRAGVARCAPEDRQIARLIWGRPPSLADDADPISRVLRNGEPELIDSADQTVRTTLRSTALGHDVMHRLAPRSWMTVPLRARGSIIGTLTFLTARSNRRLGESHLGLAQQLADRIVLAVDNARLYQEAARANEAKSAFLAVMSHELRTPLTAILGYTELLADGLFGEVNDQQLLQLGRVRESSEQLLRIVDSILHYARLEAREERPEIDDVDVSTIVAQTLALVRPLAERKRISLVVIPPPEGLTLRTDAGQLRQVLVSLLENAVKFTDEGEITLIAGRHGDDALFEVRDTGHGMSPVQMTRIFEPFWQADQRLTRSQPGSGLGLSVTRGIVSLLRGALDVESTEGVGSTFRLRVPLDAFSGADDVLSRPAPPARSSGECSRSDSR